MKRFIKGRHSAFDKRAAQTRDGEMTVEHIVFSEPVSQTETVVDEVVEIFRPEHY